jgi:ferrochelatase
MIDCVLLIGFGGPTAPAEIRPFLANVVRGRNVPPERLEEVAHHYEMIGGRSPYNELTLRQAELLADRLAAAGWQMPVAVGMRNWPPLLAGAVDDLAQRGCRRAAGVILAPHRSQTSWERYQLDVRRALDARAVDLAVRYLPPWHLHPQFIAAQAARVEEATGYRAGEWPAGTPVVFTAHSIPCSMAETSRYAEEVAESSAAVAARLAAARWSVAYQSRSGDPRAPWLEPDVNEVIRRLAGEGAAEVVLTPVGFLCDHVEVLFDLDVEAQATAAEAGIRVIRAGTVGDHPLFIEMLADLIVDLARNPR